MNYINIIIAIIAFNVSFLQGQEYLATVKVISEVDGTDIENAFVEIQQLPGVIIPTDSRGISTFNKVPSGRITIRVSAKGYLAKTEHYNIVSGEEKNNYYIIKLNSTTNNSQYLIYGEIVNEDGQDLSDAQVEIKFLNRKFSTKTDRAGDFAINVPTSIATSTDNFRIEVSHGSCKEKYRELKSILLSKNIEINITLNCKESTTKTAINTQSIDNTANSSSTIPGLYEGDYRQWNRGTNDVPMIFNIESISGNIIKGKINWPEFRNTIVEFTGTIIERDKNDFVEEVKWRTLDEHIQSEKILCYFIFTQKKYISNNGVALNNTWYSVLGTDGQILGFGYKRGTADSFGSFRIDKSIK